MTDTITSMPNSLPDLQFLAKAPSMLVFHACLFPAPFAGKLLSVKPDSYFVPKTQVSNQIRATDLVRNEKFRLGKVIMSALNRLKMPAFGTRGSAIVFGPLSFALMSCAQAISLYEPTESESGWSADVHGLVSVWAIGADFEFGPTNEEKSFRVQSGYNPSNLEFVVKAPQFNGISVSSNFQVDVHINGPKTRSGEVIEIRRASIDVASSIGTFQIGRDFGVFASGGVLNDPGSLRGVGYLCNGVDGPGGTCGRIGTGYTWSDFGPGIRYRSPESDSGFEISAAIFDPTETVASESDIETSSPAFEAQLNFNTELGSESSNLSVWVGGFFQDLDDLGASHSNTSIIGANIGSTLTLGNFKLTANYESNEGIGEGFHGVGIACNSTDCDAVEGDQWYLLVDYKIGNTVYGASYGEGSEEANAIVGNDNVDRELTMVYVQHQITPELNVNLELHSFERNTDGAGVATIFQPQEEYSAVMLGAEYRF